jgi:hypothetical protein
MSAKSKLRNALSALEDALRHVKRAKSDAPQIDDLRRAKREIEEAIDEVERTIRELPD